MCEALAHLESGSWQVLSDPHLVSSLEELGLADEDALIELLMDLLESIRSAGPHLCYAGGKPPAKSYEPEIAGLELWAFKAPRLRSNQTIYLKFALKKGMYIHVSCHEDRP